MLRLDNETRVMDEWMQAVRRLIRHRISMIKPVSESGMAKYRLIIFVKNRNSYSKFQYKRKMRAVSDTRKICI